jgi:hypothetical protein
MFESQDTIYRASSHISQFSIFIENHRVGRMRREETGIGVQSSCVNIYLEKKPFVELALKLYTSEHLDLYPHIGLLV